MPKIMFFFLCKLKMVEKPLVFLGGGEKNEILVVSNLINFLRCTHANHAMGDFLFLKIISF